MLPWFTYERNAINPDPTGFDEFHDCASLCQTGGLIPWGISNEYLMAVGDDYEGVAPLDAPDWIPGGGCDRSEDWLGESVCQYIIARNA